MITHSTANLGLRTRFLLCVTLAAMTPVVAAAENTNREAPPSPIVTGNTEFALDLYQQLRTSDGNLVLSPYSISTALAMTYAGARTTTAAQMADVLHFSPDQPSFHAAFSSLQSETKDASTGSSCRLEIANALWGQEGEPFLKDFLGLVRDSYQATFRELDFARATEQARRTINSWIADQTHGRIEELLAPSDLDAAAALVLTNAIYFKGTWANRFSERATLETQFFVSKEKTVKVSMMTQGAQFGFARVGDVDVLELPYEGDRLSMVVVLPIEQDGLERVERSLDAERLTGWVDALEQHLVQVRLPRFKMDVSFDLSRTLAAMGMPEAFTSKADFSGMNGAKDLFLSVVRHEAEIEVNEEGTEASAATAVIAKRRASSAMFNANHPFLFLVRDRHTGSILFLGRVVDPKG